MAELQNKQRPQVAASDCKIIDKSALSAQFPPPAPSACSSTPPSACGHGLSVPRKRPPPPSCGIVRTVVIPKLF